MGKNSIRFVSVSSLWIISGLDSIPKQSMLGHKQTKLEGKYSVGSTDPRKSKIRAHLRP